MSRRWDFPQRLTIPRVREARLSLGWSTISTDSGDLSSTSPEQDLDIVGGDNVSTSIVDGKVSIAASGSFTAGTGVSNGLFFGDGDTSIYEYSDDLIVIRINGTDRYQINASHIGTFLTGGGAITQGPVTGTVPTLIPNRTDPYTGIGKKAGTYLSIITNSKETIRTKWAAGSVLTTCITGNATMVDPVNTLDVKGNQVIGANFSGITAAPTNGLAVQGPIASKKNATTLGVGETTFAITSNFHVVTGDGGGNTIGTITGGYEGQILILLFVDGNVTITDDNTHAADSVDLSAAFTSADDTTLTLVYDGTSWYELSRSVN